MTPAAPEATSRAPVPAAITAFRVPLREALGVFMLGLAWALLVRPGPLSLPYFWDEADVYAPGAKWLADHDLDPTPGHFPDDWSRGHPQLLYVLAAFAFRLFGPGPAVGHALIVPFTALAIAATYVLGAERAGAHVGETRALHGNAGALHALRGPRLVGAGAALLIATSPLFMSMGAFLLPEMPLTALTALALVFTARGQLVAAAGVGVALVALKETGVGPPIAIAGGLALEALRARAPRASALRSVAIALTPVLALIGFFVWQRLTAGYFVFPHHQHLFTDRPFGIANVVTVVPSVFLWHGRWIVTAAALIAVVALIVRRAWPVSLRADATNLAILLLLLGNAVFFAKMFWLERYALPVHPGLCALMVVALVEAARLLPTRLQLLAAAAPCAVAVTLGLNALRAPGEAAEHSFAFADIVDSHRQAYARIAQLDIDDPIVVTTWPLTTELREPWLGFVETPVRSLHPDLLDQRPNTRPDVVLVDEGSHERDRLRTLARQHGLRLRSTVQRGTAPRLELWSR